MDATIAIASFGTLPLLRAVCGACRATVPGAEILVVDTGSRDGSREWAAGRPWLRLEALDGISPGAPAHAAALDRALALARGRVLVTLDSDAVPRDPAWLAVLQAELDRPPAAAACGTTKDAAGISPVRLAMAALGRRLGRMVGLAAVARGLGLGSTELERVETQPEAPTTVGHFRRCWGRRGRGPDGGEAERLRRHGWSYLRPNRALYRTVVLRRLGLSFGGADGKVGAALSRALEAAGESIRLLPPERMEALVVHLKHATMALHPELFPGMRGRDVRAARARVEAFLASEHARRAIAAGD